MREGWPPPCGKTFCPRHSTDHLCEACLINEVERLRGILAEINTIARIPTPQGMRAYTHFQRDFDKIRSLTAVQRI